MSWGLGDGEQPQGCILGPKQKFLVVPSHSELGLALGKVTAPTRGLTRNVSCCSPTHPGMNRPNRPLPQSEETKAAKSPVNLALAH